MRINQIKLLLILTIAAIMLISSTDAAADSRVNIKNGSFVPSALTVSSGTTVEWHNQDAIQHRIVSSQGLFDSGLIDPGKKFSIKFNNPGTYNYYCSLHPQMQGSVTVSGTTAMGAQQTSLSASWSESPLSASSGDSVPIPTVGAAAGATTSSSQIASSTGSGSYAKTGRSTSSQVSVEKYSQYYSSSTGTPEEQLTAPTQVQLNEVQPDTLYFGASQTAVPYTQYQTYSLSTGGNWLWISGRDSWTQYAMVPLGSVLNLIAISPSGGYGSLYEIYPGGDLNENTYSFYAYNQLRFYADEVGQHLLFFNVANQPSNVIVIDVVPYQPTYPSVYGY